MPLFKKIIEENYTLVVWHLTEDEAFFLPYINKFAVNPEDLDTIHFPQRRKEWLSSRYIGWNVAKEMQNSCDGIWSDEHNKPHFKNSNLQISISHATPYVAVLINKNGPCGIDIEEKKEKLIKLAPKFLTEREMKLANGSLDKLALAWGAKEAIYKLYGRKQLIFKENIFLPELNDDWSIGKMTSILRVNGVDTPISIKFEEFNGHILVYTN